MMATLRSGVESSSTNGRTARLRLFRAGRISPRGEALTVRSGNILVVVPLPTVWVDTCVMVDIYSQISIYKNAVAGDHAVEATRTAMQAAFWLAMAFDAASTVTVSLKEETRRVMLTRAPPGTSVGAWTAAATYVLHSYVFPAWDSKLDDTPCDTVTEPDGTVRPSTNDERDQLGVDIAKQRGLTFLSSDKRARKRATDASVPTTTPGDFASRVITLADARARFLSRLGPALLRYVASDYLDPKATDAADVMDEVYRVIWSP